VVDLTLPQVALVVATLNEGFAHLARHFDVLLFLLTGWGVELSARSKRTTRSNRMRIRLDDAIVVG
jgi:hypothetical protein